MSRWRGDRNGLGFLVLAALLGLGGFFLLRDGGGEPREGIARGVGPAPVGPRGPETAALPPLARPDEAERRELEAAGSGEQLDELAAALCGFEGRLLRPDGEPAVDELVRILRFDQDAFWTQGLGAEDVAPTGPRIESGSARSDQEGRFLITGVWPRGMYVMRAGIDGEAPLWQLLERAPGPGELVDLGDIHLPALATLVGHVIDEEDQPVPDAWVRAIDVPAELLTFAPVERFHPKGAMIVREGSTQLVISLPPWVAQRIEDLPLPATYTDAEGAFRLAGVAVGSNTLMVSADGLLTYVSPRLDLVAGEERDLGEIELENGSSASGRVVDSSGQAVAGAEVLVAPTTPTFPVDFAGPPLRADEDGRFRHGGLPDGQVTVAARRDGGDPWTIAASQDAREELRITLPGRHGLRVMLMSRAGLEISSPSLRLMQQGQDEMPRVAVEMALLGLAPELSLAGRVRQDPDGWLSVLDLPAGNYVLLASSAGHSFAAEAFELATDRELILSLDAQRRFRVRVVDEAGRGVAGASVHASPEDSGDDALHGTVLCGSTAADGTLTVTQVHADRVTVTARHPAYGSATAETNLPVEEVRLVLLAPGALDGTLTEGGELPEPGKWMVVINGSDGMFGLPSLATPDLEGRFTVNGLQPGAYTAMPMRSQRALASLGSLMTMSGATFMSVTMPESFVIHSGERTNVVLDTEAREPIEGPVGRVSGTVFVDGRPGEGLRVAGWASGGPSGWRRFEATVDAMGRFELGEVPAARIQLNVTRAEAGTSFAFGGTPGLHSQSFQLEEGEQRVLEIEVRTSSLSGTVLDAEGAPASAARVGLSGAGHGSTLCDPQGRFSFTSLPEGTYAIDARGAKDSGRATLEVRLVAGAAPPRVDLRLERTYSVSGRLDISPFGDEPPRWMWLTLVPVQEGDGESARVGGGGTQVASNGSFSVTGLLPGSYTGRLSGSFQGRWELEAPLLVANRDLESLHLRLVQREPPPPPPAAEKED